MDDNSMKKPDMAAISTDPVFLDIFLPLYQNYKQLDRGFDKKMIDKDIEALRRKFETISKAKQRRKATF